LVCQFRNIYRRVILFHVSRIEYGARFNYCPLVNSYAVFVLVLAPLLARQIEKVTLRKAAGAVLVVAGIFLISTWKN
jgi:drug/metabolite transporter (DMT)-like permease